VNSTFNWCHFKHVTICNSSGFLLTILKNTNMYLSFVVTFIQTASELSGLFLFALSQSVLLRFSRQQSCFSMASLWSQKPANGLMSSIQ